MIHCSIYFPCKPRVGFHKQKSSWLLNAFIASPQQCIVLRWLSKQGWCADLHSTTMTAGVYVNQTSTTQISDNIVSLLWSAQRFHQKDSGERETGHCCADDLVCCGGHGGTQQQRSPMQHAPCLFLYPNMGNTILLVPSCWKCSTLVSALSFHGRWRFVKKIIQKNLKLWISEDQETTRALVIYSFPIHYASLTI